MLRPRTLLVAPPWMKATWPSLGIASLKSFLAARGVAVRACHLHLEAAGRLGLGRYDALAETWGAGEALFGALLEPDEAPRLLARAAELLDSAGRPEAARWVETDAAAEVSDLIESWLERERPESYAVVGGSVGAVQLCGALYLMRRIRQRGHPGLRVLGGSGLVGPVAGELLARTDDVDVVVDGEGEEAMLALIEAEGRPQAADLPGSLVRDRSGRVVAGPRAAAVNLAAAPAPDLDEFFATAAELGVPKTALTISLEHSRGCAWEHRAGGGELKGCTFCGLYRTSADFRRKPVARVLAEIAEAVARHRVLNVAFVDAYLGADYRLELLAGLAELEPDLTFFTELRCDLDRPSVEALVRAGVGHVQLGVESFSTPVLRHIDKGVGGARTVYSLRLCQEHGISTQYNLMVRIPGVARHDVEELARTLPRYFGLVPPQVADFYLDRNSRAHAGAREHGIDPDSLDGERPDWLPTTLGDSRITQVVPFEPLDDGAEEAWCEVERQVEAWRERWQAARRAGIRAPLVWRDGGDWAQVTDARGEEVQVFQLEGVLYQVFRALSDPATEPGLAAQLPTVARPTLVKALAALEERDLVLRDGSLWVGLAISARPRRPAAAKGREVPLRAVGAGR